MSQLGSQLGSGTPAHSSAQAPPRQTTPRGGRQATTPAAHCPAVHWVATAWAAAGVGTRRRARAILAEVTTASRDDRTRERRRWGGVCLAVMTLGCGHHGRSAGPAAPPPMGDVAAMLAPCPPGFVGRSVREIRSRQWPRKSCFALRGRLIATVGAAEVCTIRPLDSAGGPGQEASGLRCARGWVLTDPDDPPLVERDEFHDTVDPNMQHFIALLPVGPYEPWLLPLARCNRNDDGRALMPASTRFDLPSFREPDAARLNAELSGVTVGVFGGMNAREWEPEKLEDFRYLVETHVCRLNGGDQKSGG